MQSLFANFYGQDATPQWNQVVAADPNSALYLNCINNLFHIGVLDERESVRCLVQYYVCKSSPSYIKCSHLRLYYASSFQPNFLPRYDVLERRSLKIMTNF